MTTCYMHNVYLCFLPAHTSHGLQPLDNGVFNVLKAAYRIELSNLAILTDAAPVDKINFIRCYTKARQAITPRTIKNSFRTTGNWPINRKKALNHPEIQPDNPEREATPSPAYPDQATVLTPKTSRAIIDFSKEKSPTSRLIFRKIGKAFKA
jgi:hypothetical protein